MLTDKNYRDAVRHEYGNDGEIEIDDTAEVSNAYDVSGEPGAWVQAWIWMSERDAESWIEPEPAEYYGEPPVTNAERLENGKVTPR